MVSAFKTFSRAVALAAFTALPALVGDPVQAATVQTIDVGPQTGTYTSNVRGFWFTAPTDFWITGIDVPTDASTANFNAVVLRLTDVPPLWSNSTTDYDLLYRAVDQATAVTGLSIAIKAGDIIGVLGNRGNVNSYGASPYTTSILGESVTLTRFGTQTPITEAAFPGADVWTENGGSISRVNLTVTDVAPVPVPASIPLLLTGLGVLTVLRRRRS